MKSLAIVLIFPLILLGPILDDKEAIFFPSSRDRYDVQINEIDSKIEGEPFNLHIIFRPHPRYGFHCNNKDSLRLVMSQDLYNASDDPYIDYDIPVSPASCMRATCDGLYCGENNELEWVLWLNSHNPGKHRIDLSFKFDFCTNIKNPTRHVCVEENRNISIYVVINKKSKWLPLITKVLFE